MTDSRWQLLTDALPDGILLLDPSGLARYLNPAAESATEVLRSEAIGRPLQEFVERSRLDLSFLPEALASGAKLSRNEASPSTGLLYNVITRSVRDWHGNVACFIVIIRNATEPTLKSDESGIATLRAETSDVVSMTAGILDPVVLCERTSTLFERGLRTIRLGSRLLLLGESGVGKTEFARLLHRRSGSANRPFIHVNCGSIPEALFESEMFGYERGSFTGALAKGKRGLVEAADGGTLFLDEVGEIPLPLQAKMLQFMEEGGVQRVGATEIRRLRVQIITATNRDLSKMVAEGGFRPDLYYRLNVVTLHLPPLRECTEMLEELTDRFVAQVNRRRATPLRLDRVCRARLHGYSFPGNIRELQNLIEHLAVVSEGNVRERDVLEALNHVGAATSWTPMDSRASVLDAERSLAAGEPLRRAVRRYEERLIREAIAQTGSKRKAAELLGVDIATVVRKSRDLDS
jgi:transcriptional regulator with PAS, ATPase and Fis domain